MTEDASKRLSTAGSANLGATPNGISCRQPTTSKSQPQSGNRDGLDTRLSVETYDGEELICKYYDCHSDDFVVLHGVMQLVQEDRVRLLTSHSVDVDTPIFVKRIAPSKNANKDGLDLGEHALVISCKGIGEDRHQQRYVVTAVPFRVE
jgi:hypothetical protein